MPRHDDDDDDELREFIAVFAEAVHREIRDDPELTAAYRRRLDKEAQVVETLARAAATHDTTDCVACADGLKFGQYCAGVGVARWSEAHGEMATIKAFLMAVRMLGDRLVAEDVIQEAEAIRKAGG